MTSQEDKFMLMDEGELVSECLQIASFLSDKQYVLPMSVDLHF